VWLPPLQSATGTPVITLAQLARFLRRPVGAFFRERLQVHLEDERSELHDEELFGLAGLDLYQLLEHELAHVPVDLASEQLPGHVQRVVQGLRKAGALPLAGVGLLEAQKLSHSLETLLTAALNERAGYPNAAQRVLVDLPHAHVHLQDALGGLLAAEGGQEEGGPDGGQMALTLRANSIARIQGSGEALALPDKLIDVWLTSLAAAAMGQPLPCVVVGRNAVVRVPPQDPEAARAQLQVLLDTWVEGMRWPLPLPPALALKWLEKKDNANALLDLYEGSSHQRAEVRQDPALARTYPTLDTLLATGAFERLAEAVYAPLKAWAAHTVVEALPDAPADTDAQEVLA
jgi:exodeoxyribonuclease V gamma subunit